MKIFSVAKENIAPSWAFDVTLEDYMKDNIPSDQEIHRVASLPMDSLSDDQVVSEREHIEVCASNGELYHYNSNWDKNVVSQLREYASVCGMPMDNFRLLTPEYIDNIKVIQERVASTETLEKDEGKNMLKLDDPFKLEEKADTSHMDKDNWEAIDKQANLKDKPSMMSDSVKPLRGGEDYNSNSYHQTARGQNSITNPNAIEQLIATEEDSGARLRRENEEREGQRERNHQTWQADKVEAMGNTDMVPKGKVFPTEVMNAQTGLNTSAHAMANMKAEDLPEKTEGELISENNEARKESIQRPKEDNSWESLKSASVRGISDNFTDSLKKALGK